MDLFRYFFAPVLVAVAVWLGHHQRLSTRPPTSPPPAAQPVQAAPERRIPSPVAVEPVAARPAARSR